MATSIENRLSLKCCEVDRIMRAWALATAEKDVLTALLKQERAGER